MAKSLEPLQIGGDMHEVVIPPASPWRSEDEPEVEARSKKWNIRQIITVEPLIFLFMCASGVHGPAVAALTYHKVCMMNFHSAAVCDNLKNGSFNDEEDVVQTYSSHWFLYQTLAFELPSIILSFFYGAVSDHFSRRLALALPLVGQAITVGNYMLCAVYIESHVAYIVVGHVISGFFGGWITCLLAAFSYLSEITTEHTRTSRIAIVEGVISLSIALSYFVSGIILDHTSYVFVFSLAMALYLLGVLYICAWIQEPKKTVKEKGKLVKSFREVFRPKRIKEAFTCMLKKRDGGMRKRLLLLLLGVFTTMLSYNALYTLGYLYLKRRPLSWTQSTFGMYVGYFKGISGIALLLLVPLMKQKLRMTDTTIILVSLASSSVSELLFGFSVTTWMVFLVPVIGLLGDAKMTCMRAMLSTFVQKDELGQLFAAVGSIQSLSGLVGSTVFNTLYPVTLKFWPGFCFSLGVMISFLPLSIIWWLHRDLKRCPRYVPLGDMAAGSNDGEVYVITGTSGSVHMAPRALAY